MYSAFHIELFLGLTMEGCEDGWIFHKHLCYQLNSDPYSTLTHGEAIAVCMAKGADLTSVWGKKERDFISQELLNVSHLANVSAYCMT